MIAKEIREMLSQCGLARIDGIDVANVFFLAEIAAQLAELNENLKVKNMRRLCGATLDFKYTCDREPYHTGKHWDSDKTMGWPE